MTSPIDRSGAARDGRFDAIVIGGGPAGCSAALALRMLYRSYLARRTAVYRAETRWTDRPFWARHHTSFLEN